MTRPSSFDPVAYIRAMRRAGMYVEPFHEKRTFFVGNPRGMGEAYSRVCRRFRAPSTPIGQRQSGACTEALCKRRPSALPSRLSLVWLPDAIQGASFLDPIRHGVKPLRAPVA